MNHIWEIAKVIKTGNFGTVIGFQQSRGECDMYCLEYEDGSEEWFDECDILFGVEEDEYGQRT